MGLYINPPDMSKEDWLARHGTRISVPLGAWDFSSGRLVVCLVDNGAFTAAGIADSQDELEVFRWGGDPRPKQWYSVPSEKLAPYMKGDL